MRSMGEGHALAILTFWRGDILNVPLHRLRRSPSPARGGVISPSITVTGAITPETAFACNVGFGLRCGASRPHLLRDRLFEHVDPQPGCPTP